MAPQHSKSTRKRISFHSPYSVVPSSVDSIIMYATFASTYRTKGGKWFQKLSKDRLDVGCKFSKSCPTVAERAYSVTSIFLLQIYVKNNTFKRPSQDPQKYNQLECISADIQKVTLFVAYCAESMVSVKKTE